MRRYHPSAFSLLARLWLHEPDAATLAHVSPELGLPLTDPSELGPAYTDLFLLNVYPYGTALTDPAGELNAPAAHDLAALYEARGYAPPELSEVAAPDHVLPRRRTRTDGPRLLPRPRCSHPRNPLRSLCSSHFAPHTSHFANLQSPITHYQLPITALSLDDELALSDLLHFWLTPALSGMFLSRSRLGRLANNLGLSLPFGPRHDVAEWLFTAAGETGNVARLIAALEAEATIWRDEYHRWSETYPSWRPIGEKWLSRIDQTMRQLTRLREASGASS